MATASYQIEGAWNEDGDELAADGNVCDSDRVMELRNCLWYREAGRRNAVV